MPSKSFLKKIDLYQVILGILGGVICFFVWPNGTDLIHKTFSLPAGHTLTATMIIFGPIFFGVIAYSISKGNPLQRIVYLIVGSVTLSISLIIYFSQFPKDPVYGFFPIGLAIIAAIMYFVGGVCVFTYEFTINFIKNLTKSST